MGELESVQGWEAACEWAAEQQRGAGLIACALNGYRSHNRQTDGHMDRHQIL